MSNLYIITGPAGVGKSTISERIAKSKSKSVLIEGDDIYHQVIGGYVQAWKEGNHLKTFWKICINTIKIYLEDGYDVVFNYIVTPTPLKQMYEQFKSYTIKFIVLLVDENTLLLRDKERPETCQMKERCITLLNNFKNNNYNKENILDTTNLSIDETVNIIETNNRFILSEIRLLTDFQEKFFKSEIIRTPNYLEFNKNIPELSVSNLENSLNFYKIAGFKIEYDRPENKFAFISLGEIQFMLQEITDNEKWSISPLSYPFGNGINFQLEVNHVEEIYSNYKNSNYKIAFDIEENWYRQDNKLLGNKEFLIQDPDGYLLRFSEDLGEKEG